MAALARAWHRLARNDQLVLAVLAVVVGTAAGYGSVAFRVLIWRIQDAFFGYDGEHLASAARALPWWQVLGAPAAGGLLIGVFMHRFSPGRLPQGVADVIEASALRNARLPLAPGLGAAAVSAASLGCGASVGREGPIVHLGATLGSYVARRLHLGPSLSRTLLGCGVAAAIAAAFNAPIAGVFFALEVVVGHYGLGAFSPVVLASVTGTIVTRIHIGDFPAFELPGQEVASFWELPAFVLLGVVSAGGAILFMRAVALVAACHERLRTPPWLRPALAGLATGAIALRVPEVLGVGYEATDRALRAEYALETLIVIAVAKGLATALCLGSRFGGGIFSPSLVLGAMLGGVFGLVAAAVAPGLGSGAGVYAVLGMGAVAASVLGAPISTVIMVFELTHDYGVTFALMVSVAVASLLTQQLFGHSYFTRQLAERGISVTGHRELGLLRSTRVCDVMRPGAVVAPPNAGLEELKRLFVNSHAPIFVLDEAGRLCGSIAVEDLADAAFAPQQPETPVLARDLARRLPAALLPWEDLERALGVAESTREDRLPVIDSREGGRVIGEVRRADLIRAYNHALLRARAIERGES